MHPTVITTSRLINTKKIARLYSEQVIEEALEKEIKKIEQVIKQSLTDELKELVKEFIQARKKMLKNREDKETKARSGELEEQLEKEGLSEENIEKIIKYCERLIELG